MSKIIVGIHGLANKPERDVLEDWWKKSIKEGLEKNCQVADAEFDFKMVYWADLLYMNQQHVDESFDFDDLYNDQPYRAATEKPERYEDSWTDDVGAAVVGGVGATLDFLKRKFDIDAFADWVLEKTLKDLSYYYEEDRKIGDRSTPQKMVLARKVLQDELRRAILLLKDREIMLIAHSMGTIIAYDVLRDIGQEEPKFEVAEFVTIGSPLGLPHVKFKIIEERAYDGEGRARVRTPSVVTKSWTNYADRKDLVALDVHLSDDYRKNAKGVRVEDDLVLNGYESPAGDANHHKSYGYLRTPELSEQIKTFLFE